MSATAVFPRVQLRPVSGRDAISTGASIEVRSMGKRFGEREILRDINLEIRAGESVAIVGRSGSGKSTLLRLLAGIEKPNTGGVWIGGRAVERADPRVRVMFQESRLLPWKRVLDNVCTGLSADGRVRANRLLSAVGLAGRDRAWPSQLSGGQKQRVALARALAAQPDVLLLDEPLSALDALTRLEMQALIEQLWREAGFTLVLVTHDVEEAIALADRVFVMTDGAWSKTLTVDLPRPRDRARSEFIQRRMALLHHVMSNAGDENGRADRAALTF